MMRRRGERKAGKSHQRRYVPLIVIAVAVFELYRIASMYYSMTRRDPIPRAFERYGSDLALSCVPPGDRWYGESAQETPIKRGLFFVNLLKTGSSTAAGIHLRISKNLARRLHQGEEHKWPICSSRFRNGLASFMEYGSRNRKASFLWTTVREPTARATSQFFHFMVSKQEMDATERNFRDTFLHGSMMDYYLKSLSTDVHVPGVSDAVNTINSILDNYDFIGITERMDESAVALMMILDIPLGDILHLSAKQSGRYDDGGEKAQCFLIPEAKSTHGMQTVIASPEWKAQVQNDLLFYETANKSLDMTIQKLGKAAFDKNLKRFRKAQEMVEKKCRPLAIFPCDDNGVYTPREYTNCLWKDSGCANDCVDQIALQV